MDQEYSMTSFSAPESPGNSAKNMPMESLGACSVASKALVPFYTKKHRGSDGCKGKVGHASIGMKKAADHAAALSGGADY